MMPLIEKSPCEATRKKKTKRVVWDALLGKHVEN